MRRRTLEAALHDQADEAAHDQDEHRRSRDQRDRQDRTLSFGVAPFESLVFAVTLCRHRNRDLYHGLLVS